MSNKKRPTRITANRYIYLYLLLLLLLLWSGLLLDIYTSLAQSVTILRTPFALNYFKEQARRSRATTIRNIIIKTTKTTTIICFNYTYIMQWILIRKAATELYSSCVLDKRRPLGLLICMYICRYMERCWLKLGTDKVLANAAAQTI